MRSRVAASGISSASPRRAACGRIDRPLHQIARAEDEDLPEPLAGRHRGHLLGDVKPRQRRAVPHQVGALRGRCCRDRSRKSTPARRSFSADESSMSAHLRPAPGVDVDHVVGERIRVGGNLGMRVPAEEGRALRADRPIAERRALGAHHHDADSPGHGLDLRSRAVEGKRAPFETLSRLLYRGAKASHASARQRREAVLRRGRRRSRAGRAGDAGEADADPAHTVAPGSTIPSTSPRSRRSPTSPRWSSWTTAPTAAAIPDRARPGRWRSGATTCRRSARRLA